MLIYIAYCVHPCMRRARFNEIGLIYTFLRPRTAHGSFAFRDVYNHVVRAASRRTLHKNTFAKKKNSFRTCLCPFRASSYHYYPLLFFFFSEYITIYYISIHAHNAHTRSVLNYAILKSLEYTRTTEPVSFLNNYKCFFRRRPRKRRHRVVFVRSFRDGRLRSP